MKILLTLYDYLNLSNSGAPGSVLNIRNCYQQLGHEVYCFSRDDLPQKLSNTAKTILFPEFVAAHILKTTQKYGIDIVDTSPGDAWVWANTLRYFQKKPPLLVTRSHGLSYFNHLEILKDFKLGNLDLNCKYWLYRGSIKLREENNSIKNSDLVFPLNRLEAQYIAEKIGLSTEQIYISPNGIPDHFLNLPFEDTPQDYKTTIRIAHVGSYSQRKGIQFSIPALNRILTLYPQVEASFFGTEFIGIDTSNSDKRGLGTVSEVYAAIDTSVRARVRVIPRFEHKILPSLLKGHHINLFPTLAEGFGKTLVESMACGLAPVTTPAAGPMDVVTNEHDSIVVPFRNSAAIEQALEKLINDRVLLDKIRRNAYKTAQTYGWQKIAEGRLNAYQRAIMKKFGKDH